MLGSYLWFIW